MIESIKFHRSLIALVVCLIFTAAEPAQTGTAPAPLHDVPYSFDAQKLSAAGDAFHFLRSFVDYFYLVIKENKAILSTVKTGEAQNGWCIGDAHPENFGALILKNGSNVFTANDIDDSGPCPIVIDVFRLMVSSRLYDPSLQLDAISAAYLEGVDGKSRSAPNVVSDMISKSLARGTATNPKAVDQNQFLPTAGSRALSSSELAEITAAFASMNGISKNAKILDSFATKKVGGGSGGLSRFEVLVANGKDILHLEFKEQVAPAVASLGTLSIPDTKNRIALAISANQGVYADPIYQYAKLSGVDMLVRPRYYGNVGANLAKNTAGENRDLIQYEAYVLGQIHRRTISNPAAWAKLYQTIPIAEWESDVTAMSLHFTNKFKSLP